MVKVLETVILLDAGVEQYRGGGGSRIILHSELMMSSLHCDEGNSRNPNSYNLETQGFRYWMPCGVPPGESVCVASSRLTRRLEDYESWFDALRTIAIRMGQGTSYLVTSSGTTTDRFVKRVGELFGIPILDILPTTTDADRKELLRQQTSNSGADQGVWPCYVQRTEMDGGSGNAVRKFPIDRALIEMADLVFLLSVRKQGNIFAAAKQRLTQQPPVSTRLLIDSNLTQPAFADQLIFAGAVGWWLYRSDEEESDSESPSESLHPLPTADQKRPSAPVLKMDRIQADRFLLHWTRRRDGPWPDQTDAEYLDDLIFQSGRREHGELGALARILATGRILATSRLTRAPDPVVCFSNVPLTEIYRHRKYRSHLGRWDFQPFGIAIERETMEKLGAKPVIYGEDSHWEGLPESDRPFFQIEQSRDGQIDWREEREWRVVGDLDLTRLPVESVHVFVNSPEAAQQVSKLSRWPVVIVE